MISQTEALENLRIERDNLRGQLQRLQSQLAQGNEQFLKIQGAVEVLEQLVVGESEETQVAETEVVEGEE